MGQDGANTRLPMGMRKMGTAVAFYLREKPACGRFSDHGSVAAGKWRDFAGYVVKLACGGSSDVASAAAAKRA